MKKRPAPSAARRSTPAEISITVTRFRDVLAADGSGRERATDCAMRLKRAHPRVSLKGDVIHVRRPGATLRFTVVAPAGDKEKYYPVGITFVREGERSTGDAQRLGLENFLQGRIRPDGRSLTITDSYLDKARRVRFKFTVVIQRGSDGQIGLFDPGIEHENEE